MPSGQPADPARQLFDRLPGLMLRDQHRLRRRLDDSRKLTDPSGVLAGIETDLAAATERVARRRAAVPEIRYPAELPVSQRRDDLRAAIRDHQVVIVAGETGSGKTTQLPKICLELGRGITGMIGHTQPRRLAARTVSERIAEELGTPLGEVVGYKVRFTDKVGADALVKVMTDGILLTELQSDRMLRQYDTLIIDEAHERSLNIDFILGYVKQLLPKRPDLKVVITSATIDPERFARHFGTADRPAPIVEVSGRTYPVEVRYRPLVDPDAPDVDPDRDQIQAICEAVDELAAESSGDVLVFLSGEREIRDTAEALRAHTRNERTPPDILPLYARLSAAEQHRVFAPHSGRRIVLATNVAETSLTVPGIRYVVDPGTARISRYSNRLKVQRLPIEPVSQASANQRKGRCGRLSDGICIRLYSEDDFTARPEFTEPEILRTNLASVILQMTAIGLGDLAAFPFLDPPDRRAVSDGVQLLEELGAFEPGGPDGVKGRPDKGRSEKGRSDKGRSEKGRSRRLTPLGRRLAQLPLDPRLARMVLEADRNGCVREVMVIAAALSIQDPRERPAEFAAQADLSHARFIDKGGDPDQFYRSDFLTYLRLWEYLRDKQKELSSNQFRRMCRNEYLNYLRVREWQDIFTQLRQSAKSVDVSLHTAPADPQRIHVSLLAGLLSHIGVKDEERPRGAARPGGRPVRRGSVEYLGARGAKFAIFPGSALFGKPPRWVMAAELVETSRLWGRTVARIEPEWVEPLAGHLVKRNYSEPHWEAKQGAVMGYERVTLYGVPLVTQRKVNFARIDPRLSRELFIRHALVDGDWDTRHEFFARNRDLLADVEELEHRARRRDILVEDEALFDFYDQRIPADVVSGRHFDAWWRKARRTDPDLLDFSASMLVTERADTVRAEDYPDHWEVRGLKLALSYQFEPGTAADGVTVHLPLPVLNQVSADDFDRQVPGLRHELVTALIKSMPKAVRRNYVPAPDHAAAALAGVRPDEPLLPALERELRRLTAVPVPPDSWQPDQVAEHLRMAYRVLGEDGETLGEGRDLAALQAALKPALRETLAAVLSGGAAGNGAGLERDGLRSWDFGALPRKIERRQGAFTVTGFPSLVDEGDSVAIRMLETESQQRVAMRAGTRRLLLLTLPSPAKFTAGRLSNQDKLALSRNPHRSVVDLLTDCAGCAVDSLVASAGGPAWDEAGFAALRDHVRADFVDRTMEVLSAVRKILSIGYELDRRLSQPAVPALLPALTDLRGQLSGLVYRGFVTATGWDHLPDVVRYLTGIERRLDRLPAGATRDREWMDRVHQVHAEYRELREQVPPGHPADEALIEIRWMIEELRVSYFAQTLGTAYKISDKRIYDALDALTA